MKPLVEIGLIASILVVSDIARGAEAAANPASRVSDYNVVWDSPQSRSRTTEGGQRGRKGIPPSGSNRSGLAKDPSVPGLAKRLGLFLHPVQLEG